MIKLYENNISTEEHVVILRNKILESVGLLTNDEFYAAKTASEYSLLLKEHLSLYNSVVCSLYLKDSESNSNYLEIEVKGIKPKEIKKQSSEDDFNIRKEIKILRFECLINFDNLEFVKNIFNIRSVNELILDIKEKNDELQRTLDNLKLAKDHNARMENELEVGQSIQMGMLPQNEFITDGINLYAKLIPAREVGGDFYDFFFIDEDRFCICVGDVSGKGVPAALFMAVTKTLIKSRASDDISTASILTHVNDELSRDNSASMFVTVFAAILNIKTGEFIYTNAGHNPPYIIQNSGNLLRLDTLHGPVAGAMPGMTYKQNSYTMNPGEYCVMFTDGVTEAMNIKGELYSEPRLKTLFSENTFKSVNHIVNSIVDSVSSFEDEAEQADDITVMAMKYNGMDPDTSRYQVVINNDLKEIETVKEAFEKFTKVNGIAEKMSKQFMIAIDELLNNVIHYGYPKDKENEIQVNFELSETMLSLTFIDEGIPFNPFQKAQPDTTMSIEERPIGGLGLHLVKNMMDKVEYQRHKNKNIVKITKLLANPSS